MIIILEIRLIIENGVIFWRHLMNKEEALEKINQIILSEDEYLNSSITYDALTKEVHLLRHRLHNIADVYFGTENRFSKSLDQEIKIKGNNILAMKKSIVDFLMSIAIAMKERIELQPIDIEISHENLLIPLNPKKVFVIHGRNEDKRKDIFQFLRCLNLEPIEWTQAIEMTGVAAPYIGEILDVAFSNAQAIIILLTPDDVVKLRDELQTIEDDDVEKNFQYQPRPNVLFEAGMAIARNEKRTIIIQIGKVKVFSDIGGRYILHLNNSPERRQFFIHRLSNAGCSFTTSGNDWLNVGNFEIK
jgi:predicted nucleotide-binding protein